MTEQAKVKAASFVAEIDPNGLAVILMSIGCQMRKTERDKRSDAEIIADAKKTWPREAGPFPFDLMAQAAIIYVAEAIKGAKVLN